LTFDEFLAISPCTTGKHSTVDDTPKPEPAIPKEPPPQPVDGLPVPAPRAPQAQAPSARPAATPAPPESEDDDPSLPIPSGQTCRRRGCNEIYSEGSNRTDEKCIFHPGHPIFHEGSKGYTCCKKRVLDFDDFLKMEGCKSKDRHMFVGSGKKQQGSEENLESVR